jgi:hypothetical protein
MLNSLAYGNRDEVGCRSVKTHANYLQSANQQMLK